MKRLIDRVNWQVEWGEASMLQAERLLLKEALQDPLNQRFILLSDRCTLYYHEFNSRITPSV